MNKTYNGFVPNLKKNQIFVFGSNTQGRHGKGSALIAKTRYGAIYGVAKGLQGQSYAIITKDLTKSKHPSISKDFIKEQILELYKFAETSPELEFFIVYKASSTNLNNYIFRDGRDVLF